jgi:dTDP-4-amino-4,6-dideoxygalactose transaminase
VGEGSEVITTPNTFIATAEAISYTNARPVFVDIDPATANLDPALVERAITPRTKAIISVHLYGRPADLDPIMAMAKKRGIAVIEDACQAHGARYRGRRVGGIGQSAAFSFYPGKNLGAYGEGGALTTNDERIAQFARAMRDHGQTCRYFHDYIGYNYRMDGFQGAVLRVKLRRLDEWTVKRQQYAALYRKLLDGTKATFPADAAQNESVYHLFVVYVDNRDAVREALQKQGVQTAVHYPRAVPFQKAYTHLGYRSGDLPHTVRACERVFSMPLFPEMTTAQVEYAAKTLREAVENG